MREFGLRRLAYYPSDLPQFPASLALAHFWASTFPAHQRIPASLSDLVQLAHVQYLDSAPFTPRPTSGVRSSLLSLVLSATSEFFCCIPTRKMPNIFRQGRDD